MQEDNGMQWLHFSTLGYPAFSKLEGSFITFSGFYKIFMQYIKPLIDTEIG